MTSPLAMLSPASALSVLALPAWADAPDGPYYGHMMWGGGMVGPIMMLLFFVLVVGAVVVAMRLFGFGGSRTGTANRALEILEERYARGEIDRAELEERKSVLKGR